VTLDGSPDLTDVAIDGSHVLYLADSTAGVRNFSAISAKDNSAKTVTVSNAFGLSQSGLSWAIGGKRASIGSTTSRKLIENNSAAGDAMPGWVIEMESGHTETLAATLTFRRAGSLTGGPIILRGTAGAATLPVLTFSNNGSAFVIGVTAWQLRDFEMRNSNVTKTLSIAIVQGAAQSLLIERLKIAHSTNKFWKGYQGNNNAAAVRIIGCEIGHTANIGIEMAVLLHAVIVDNYIHDCATRGILVQAVTRSLIIGNIAARCDAANLEFNSTSALESAVLHNTLVGSTANSGLYFNVNVATGPLRVLVANNLFAYNASYGIDVVGTVTVTPQFSGTMSRIINNGFFSNASGQIASILESLNEQPRIDNPGFVSDVTSTSTHDFTIGTPYRGKAYPIPEYEFVGRFSATRSYRDVGAAQRQDLVLARYEARS
jgi:hypothetical protein